MLKPSLRQILDLRLGGCYDNIGLMTGLGGAMLANPALAFVPNARLAGLALASVGACMLGRRLLHVGSHRAFESEVQIESHEGRKIDLSQDWGGVLLGYTTDKARPVIIPWDDWMRHCFILGQSGMGKTVLGEWLMFQHIVRGGGVFWIDGKIDYDNIQKLNAMCAYAGRRHDLRVINPDNPQHSNTYNPILDGDADEVASRIISLIPSAENNPGADHYRQSANQGVTTTVGTIRAADRGYTFLDLSILLQSEEAMNKLATMVSKDSDAGAMYRMFLQRFQTTGGKDGQTKLDLKKISDLFGGVGGRLFSFGEGNFGKITNTYNPEVQLFQDIRDNRIVYLALPTMGKNEAAGQFGKMAIGDYRSAIAKIQALPKGERPWPPTLGFFDEAGSYVNDAWSRIFEQSRSAHQVLVPAVQTVANLDKVSKELREMVVGNTVTKAVFRVGTEETAKTIADLIGKENAVSIGVSGGMAKSNSAWAGMITAKSNSQNESMNYSESSKEVYRVSTTDLKSLEKGEAIVTTDGVKVHHVKIPRVHFSDAFMRAVGDYEVNRLARPKGKGLDFFNQFGKPGK